MTIFSQHSKACEVPSETWHEVLHFCSLEDIVRLEQTCHFFHDLISDRPLWLYRLRDLDQMHAPNLPPYISTDSLNLQELRDLVIRARRRVLYCTSSSPLRVGREVVIPVGQTNTNDILGEPFGWGADTLLLPGGRYFFMRWPAGYLQCWDVEAKECMWTYPEIPKDTSDIHQMPSKCCFACDTQANGDVYVSVVSETPGTDQRCLEVLRFSSPTRSLDKLFEIAPDELDIFHGIPAIAKLFRDIVVVYTEGHVIVTFWKENRYVVITEGIFDSLEIVDDYIIGITGSYEGNSLIAIPISFIRDATTMHIKLADIPITSYPITPPPHWLVGRAQLSICQFHWKERTERQEIVITVLGDVYNEQNCCDFPVAEIFSFSFDNSELSQLLNSRPVFTPLGRSQYTKFEAQYSTYSIMTPPSLSGSTVIAFHNDRNHDTQFARMLATFIPGKEIVVRVLDDTIVKSKPATYSLDVEFYSGAIHYVTSDLKNVVIQYLD